MNGFCPLASGSKGNCIFLGTKEAKILIDAGISTRATRNKLASIGVSIEEIDAILITHDHGDHIQGLKVMAFDMGIPVLANHETAKGIAAYFEECPKFKIFTTGETFEFRDLEIHPFTIPHDTLDPVGFSMRYEALKLGFCTDLGFVTSLVREQLKDTDYLYVEANHDPELVHASARPPVYKQRVLGKTGHLSNLACAELLHYISHPGLKKVILGHLSSECNTKERALETIRNYLGKHSIDLNLSVALQDTVSEPVYFELGAEIPLQHC
ncbi:MBL fold metallo-hydrolase [Estrella lausannensis]